MLYVEPLEKNRNRFIFIGAIFTLVFSGIFISFTSAFFQSSSELINFENFKKQILFHFIGICFFTLIAHTKLDIWKKTAWLLYAISILSLLLVWFPNIGLRSSGAYRWIDLYFFSFQPSNIMKLALIIVLARIFSLDTETVKPLKSFVVLGIIYIPITLILAEPDLGTSFHLLISSVSLLLLTHFPVWIFFTKICLLIPILYYVIINEPYRFLRITSFLDPYEHRYTGGFQLMASYKSFFIGEWFGRDLSEKVIRHTLQARNTDFILATIAEDTGLAGIYFLFILFIIIVCFGLYIVKDIADTFSKLLASGCLLLFAWQVLINITVTMGLIPTTGINLPLISSGGSSTISYYIILAIAASAMQNPKTTNLTSEG